MAPGAHRGRIVVAVVMGGTAFVLAVLLITAAGLPVAVATVVAALLSAGLLAAWLAKQKSSARSAWARGCLANGLLSAVVAFSFRTQDDLWVGRSQYTENLDRAIGPLTHFIMGLAARVGLVALILAAILFVLSYWLVRPPHHKV